VPSKKSTAKKSTAKQPTAGVFILQWLTYVLWAALGLLATTALANLVALTLFGHTTPPLRDVIFATVATIILLIFALVIDLLYSKREELKKSGVSSVIMVIHSVLFTIGLVISLVAATYSLANSLTETGPSQIDSQVSLAVACIAILISVALILRTSLIGSPKLARTIGRLSLITIPTVMLVISIFMVLPKSNVGQNDLLIDNNIFMISYGISSYTDSEGKLPESLNDIELIDVDRRIIDEELIEYRPNTKPADDDRHYYQLCADYKTSTENSPFLAKNVLAPDKNGYSLYTGPTRHPAGNFCYKIYHQSYEDSK